MFKIKNSTKAIFFTLGLCLLTGIAAQCSLVSISVSLGFMTVIAFIFFGVCLTKELDGQD